MTPVPKSGHCPRRAGEYAAHRPGHRGPSLTLLGGYDVVPMVEPVAERQNIRALKTGMIPLQSASIEDPWIGAVRLLAHLPPFMIP